MSARDIHMPAIVAWIFFAPGVLFVVIDIVRWNITGLFVLGVAFLVLWVWLIGGFTRRFWIQDVSAEYPDTDPLDVLEREGHR